MGGGGMAASASGSTSHGGTGSAWPVSPIPVDKLPLIECPDHPHRKFVLFTAQTAANKGRNFFRCMEKARRPDACKWFLWEDKYYEYLVDNGFLDDFHMPHGGAIQGHLIEQPGDHHGGTQGILELQQKVSRIETDIAELKQELAARRNLVPVASGDLVFLLLSLNVVAVVVAIIVALKK